MADDEQAIREQIGRLRDFGIPLAALEPLESWVTSMYAIADEIRDVDVDGTLTIHPGYQFGQVCVGATRIPAETIAGMVFAGDTVLAVADDYDLNRVQVLTACWWYTEMAGAGGSRSKSGQRIVDRWGSWAIDAAVLLGGHQSGVGCPDPPENL